MEVIALLGQYQTRLFEFHSLLASTEGWPWDGVPLRCSDDSKKLPQESFGIAPKALLLEKVFLQAFSTTLHHFMVVFGMQRLV